MAEEGTPETGKEKDGEGKPPEGTTPPETGEGAAAEAEKWKGLSRKNEREKNEALRKLQELEDKDKSELQKAQDRANELEKSIGSRDDEVKRLKVSVAVMGEAGKHGISDLDAAQRLLDWDQIEYDDKGQPTNIDKLLGALVKAKPYLAAKTRPQGSANGGEGEETGGDPTFNDMVRAQARR